MCGIVSVIQKDWNGFINYTAERIFKQMLFANALRGTDGTGIFWKDAKKNQVFYNKVAAPSWEAIPQLKELTSMAGTARWVVGHNRKSTIGVNNYDNTHPFHEGNIVLVHNGTLSNQWALEKEVGKCTVDSQAIAKLLNKEKPKQALEKLEGAYALVWHNTAEDKLYFARNEERPLWIVETELFIFLVSEPGLAHWIIERNDGIVTKTIEVKAGKIYSLFKNKANKLQTQVMNFTPKITHTAYNKYYNNYTYYNVADDVPEVPKYPVPKTESLPLFTSDDKTHEELTKWFKQGDVVLFRVTSTYHYHGKTIIKGTTLDKPHAAVEVEDSDISPAIGVTVEVIMAQIKMLYGSWRIIGVNPIVSDIEYESVNGTTLTDRILKQLDTKACIACDAKPTNDMEDAYIYYNANCREYEFLCSDCFEKSDKDTVNYGTN